MNIKKIIKKITCFLLFALICLQLFNCTFCVNAKNIASAATENSSDGYMSYLSSNSDKQYADKGITLSHECASGKKAEENGTVCNVLDENSGSVTYNFHSDISALYNIKVTYYDLLGSDLTLNAGFLLDGAAPYYELDNVRFSKIYENAEESIEKDISGNEIRPTLTCKQRFNTEFAESETGMYTEPYALYITAGNHTLTVNRVLGNMLISKIELISKNKPVSYNEYIAEYGKENIDGSASYTIEAEDIYEASNSTLAPTTDNTNPGMSPASSTKRLINSFGQDYWNSNGQWGSWIVPNGVEVGLYKLSFRFKQSGTVGIPTYRTLYINGEIPFEEAENVNFPYSSKWQVNTFSQKNDYYVYLKPGDIITFKATMGEMTEPIYNIYNTIERLNDIYQSIIVVTGTTPDTKRDYNIEKEVPTLIENLNNAKSEIDSICGSIADIIGGNNSKVYSMKRFSVALGEYIEKPEKIIDELSKFKDYIDSFSAQTYDFNSTPLELDWIALSKNDAKDAKANVGFAKAFKFEVQRFIYTFSSQYNSVDTDSDKNAKEITVWTSQGRDQAQALKTIIDNDFVPNEGIKVNFKMTSTSLSEAILSGREPDVSLVVTQDVPVDLAMRGQVLDLSPYLSEVSEEYLSQFDSSAWIPFKYSGGIYAMPITQDYYMMFYRKDIISKLGIYLPNTWDELYSVIRELKKKNFKVGLKEADSSNAGISTSISIFDMFLYQNGGRYFNDDLTETEFESQEGKNAFKAWVSLYRDFALDKDFNLLTRFRSGEMPIIITGYSFYQTVAATAREISGRWGMTLIPGTLKSDGSIDRTESSTVSGAVILSGAKKRGLADEAFKFVKWWAGSEAQFKYITAMESIQGIAGRSATANSVTFESLNWTNEEKSILKEQKKWVTAIEQIPGTYIINRSLTNALRTSYESTAVDALRQLSIQNRIINSEIKRKRAEFITNN